MTTFNVKVSIPAAAAVASKARHGGDLPARLLRIRVECPRGTNRIGAGDIGIATPHTLVLELVVKARPMHALEHLVRFTVSLGGASAADTNWCGWRFGHA